MVLVAYKIFMDGLARLMEDSAVSYQLYASLTFSTTSLLSTGRAIKGVMYMKGWRGKVFLAWFATSSIYVLGFPTLISATAGYVKPSTAGFKMADSTFLTPASSALRSCYVVHDGALIGLQNGTVVQGPPVYVQFQRKCFTFYVTFQVTRYLSELRSSLCPFGSTQSSDLAYRK